MWSVGVSKKCGLVLVNLVDPNPILVVSVLNHVKSQATKLVMDGSTSVLHYPSYESFLVTVFNLDESDYYVHGASFPI